MAKDREVPFESLATACLGDSSFLLDYVETAGALAALARSARTRLLKAAAVACTTPDASSDELFLAAHLLVGGYPETMDSIRSILKRTAPSRVLDAHFQLFFTLANIDNLPRQARDDFEKVMEAYLRTADP